MVHHASFAVKCFSKPAAVPVPAAPEGPQDLQKQVRILEAEVERLKVSDCLGQGFMIRASRCS